MHTPHRTNPHPQMPANLLTAGISGAMLGIVFGLSFGSLWLGLPVGILLGLALGYRFTVTPPVMRYPVRLVRAIFLAGAFCMMAIFVFMRLLRAGWTGSRALLAGLLPALAWALLVCLLAAAIASLDEMQRRIQTEAIAIGFAGSAVVAGGYGLLGIAGVVQVNWGLMVLVMALMWLAGKLWTMWRYR